MGGLNYELIYQVSMEAGRARAAAEYTEGRLRDIKAVEFGNKLYHDRVTPPTKRCGHCGKSS